MLCLWITTLNIVKMVILFEVVCRFNTIPIKIPAGSFHKIDEGILRFTWKCSGLRIVKTILKGKNKFGGLIIADPYNFKNYYKVTVIKTVWY